MSDGQKIWKSAGLLKFVWFFTNTSDLTVESLFLLNLWKQLQSKIYINISNLTIRNFLFFRDCTQYNAIL